MTPLKLGFLATHPIQYHAPLYRELAQRDGIDLTVYFCHRPTPEEQGDGFGVAFQWDLDLLSGYRHHFLGNVSTHPTIGFSGYDTPEIGEVIRREGFDWFIVQGWDKKSCWQAFRACRGTGTKLGVRSDSPLSVGRGSTGQRLKEVLKRALYPLFMGRFDLCLPYGELSSDYFRRYGAKRIVISPHFVDNHFFSRGVETWEPHKGDLRRQWGIPEDALCFLFCGKFQGKKHPLDILKALRQMLLAGPDASVTGPVHLLMVGDGELRDECRRYSLQHDLPVTYAGFLNQGEIVKGYVAADCLVLASDSGETWGLVVNEAMACGLPALVSASCGCTPDLIMEGETGYSFPCAAVDLLADCMLRLLLDRELLRDMSEGARRHIGSFTTNRAAESLLAALG